LASIFALPLIAATAVAQSGAPVTAVRAEAIARATIVSPVTLHIGQTGEDARIEQATPVGQIVPRPVLRECPGSVRPDAARPCTTIVFDLP
jgi:hypothetical protein